MGMFEASRKIAADKSANGKEAPKGKLPQDEGANNEAGEAKISAEQTELHTHEAKRHKDKAAHHDALSKAHAKMADHHREQSDYHLGKLAD